MPAPAAPAPLYLRLAGVMEKMIARQALQPGAKLPSVREFGRQQRVSVPTALHAYALLEDRGLVEARPKSGYYVRPRHLETLATPVTPARPVRIADLASTDVFDWLLDHSAPNATPFGAALPSPALLPGERLARIMSAAARRLGPASSSYDFAPGFFPLRREIARRAMASGCTLGPDDLVITVGTTEAIYLALRATCEAGDTVLLESPGYFGFVRQLRQMRLKAIPIPVDANHGMDVDAVAAALRRTRVSACIVTANFQNPMGCLMPDARKRDLVRLLAANGVAIIEDDIYGDLPHHGSRPRALKSYDPDGSVLLCSSFSKTLAPGYRVGYIAAGRWSERILALKKITTLAGPLLPTVAIAEFLRNGGYDRYLRSFRESCRRQVEQMRCAIGELFPAGTRVSRPAGSFLLWCELPRPVDTLQLFEQATSAGIHLAPGPMFSTHGGFRNFMRINCGYPWSPDLERSIGILAHLVRAQSVRGSARILPPTGNGAHPLPAVPSRRARPSRRR